MRIRRLVVSVLAIAATWVFAAGAQASHDDAPRAWMTTGDKTNLLTEQPQDALAAPVAGAPTITVDPARRFQRIEGFGASITDSSATLLAGSS
jgi:glucosylceramidase